MNELTRNQSNQEVQVALIQAVARVYAAGLIGSNFSPEDMRREEASRCVDAFCEKLKKVNM